ncbi:MAG: FkbM family methyltransferase [Chitinophagaceae bacterium]|nr:FkbM family methyltransferase [Chitinophagaceae bacterium]
MSNSFLKNASYTVLDWVTLKKGIARRINDIKVRFPPRWMRYFPGDYEKENYAFLKQYLKPGMDVIDIGAHIGLFSVICSQLTQGKGKIICFEPTPGTHKLLLETLKLNHSKNVTPVQAAVSDKVGNATFYISTADEGCNSNSLVKNREEKDLFAYDVKLETIDNITAGHSLKPSLIKIDVEGAELDTIKGGVQTFKNHKPVLIIGLHPAFIKQKGDSLEAIWDLLQDCRYQVKLEDKLMTKEDFCSRQILFDVVCFPA